MTCQKDGPRMESAFSTKATTSTSTSVNSRQVSPTMGTTTPPSVLLMESSSPISATDSLTHTAKDCDDIWNQGHTQNGIYKIKPSPTCTSKSLFDVVCDLETVCGGWIVIQRRFDGSENFNRGWDDYKAGFGKLTGEHWLGLEKLHRLTRNGDWKLRVEMEDFYGNTSYAEYTNFSIGDESTYYILSFGEYHGSAGDSLAFNADMAFTTNDKDHDRSRDTNCARYYEGAWWYGNCYYNGYININGPYIGSPTRNWRAMMWYHWKSKPEALKKTEMKIRLMYW